MSRNLDEIEIQQKPQKPKEKQDQNFAKLKWSGIIDIDNVDLNTIEVRPILPDMKTLNKALKKKRMRANNNKFLEFYPKEFNA